MKVTINQKQTFLICDENGDVVPGTEHGLYYLDTRFLSAFQLYLYDNDKPVKLNTLTGREIGYYSSIHYLAFAKNNNIKAESVVISRERYVDQTGLHERMAVNNYNAFDISLKLLLRFDNDFADIFEVKAIRPPEKINPKIKIQPKKIILTHDIPDFFRETRIVFTKPFTYADKIATFKLNIKARSSWDCDTDFLTLSQTASSRSKLAKEARKSYAANFPIIKTTTKQVSQEWIENTSSFEGDYAPLEQAYNQSILDLAALRLINFKGASEIPAAGIPWYTTAFGRDSLITSYQTLLVQPSLAEGTLNIMAKYQGKNVDKFTEEQPGRIIHEVRFGRLATKKMTPHAHYYGTIDATPLFIILAEQYYRWTGNKELIDQIKDNVYLALDWIDKYGDLDGDGFVEYQRTNPQGILNQGWKDSGDSTHFADGTQPETPVALVEVQGYVYLAKKWGANLLRLWGDNSRAEELEKQAIELKKRFNEAFWMEDKGYYAMGLDKNKKKIDSITSNGAHVLWTEIADADKAKKVAKRALQKDMFSGWGIRTLSSDDKLYNPASYHNGSVWPHDNSLIMVGFLKYGLEKEAAAVLKALVDTSKHFPHRRLPELFCGFDKIDTAVPVNYPTSSNPQAWAAASIPYMTFSLLRAKPDIEKRQITISPFLLPQMNKASYSGIKFANENVSIKVDRAEETPLTTVFEKPKWLEIKELGNY